MAWRSCRAALLLLLLLLPVAALICGCGILLGADWDGKPRDEGSSESDAAEADSQIDAATTNPEDADAAFPIDFECSEPWSSSAPRTGPCALRVVQVVDQAPALDATGVSIARSRAGRVAIVYNQELGANEGEMRLAVLTPSAGGVATIVRRPSSPQVHVGLRTRVATADADTFVVLAHDVDDNTSVGDVVLVKLDGAASTWSQPTLVAASVASPTELALATSGTATYAAVRTATSSTDAGISAKLVVWRQFGGEAFSSLPPLPDLPEDFPLDRPPAGTSSMALDASGVLHLLYARCGDRTACSPRYRSWNGVTWSAPKTAFGIGEAGYSPRIGLGVDQRKHATYFDRDNDGESFELHYATWLTAEDVPLVTVVGQSFPALDPTWPLFRAAMAVDHFGLLHLAIVRPLPSGSGRLEYVRQAVSPSGARSWLTDVIDPAVLFDGEREAFVDIVVDEAARPHIAYRSAAGSLVHYATRLDR